MFHPRVVVLIKENFNSRTSLPTILNSLEIHSETESKEKRISKQQNRLEKKGQKSEGKNKMSANNSGDDSECTNSSAHSYEMSGDNNYSENDDLNTESETKSVHSSYSNCSLTYCNDVVINKIDNVIVNEKHLIDDNFDDNSIRKTRSLSQSCCKLKSFGIFNSNWLFN